MLEPCLAVSPQWVQVRSPHFTVMTDASEQRGREVALRFEQMRAVFGSFMSRPSLNLPTPLQIVAFRSTKDMRRFVPLWRGKPIDMMGYFHQSSDYGLILLDLSVKNYWQTAFHEYAHELLKANTSAEMQPWFEEGFAEYFSTIRINGRTADVGAAHAKDRKVVRHKRLLSTADLLRVRQDSATYNQNGDARNVFYGQSWLMVHYLFDTHSLADAFEYFAALSARPAGVEDAFRQAFKMSPAQFDRVLGDYAQRNAFDTVTVAAPMQNASASYSVRFLSPTQADAELADVHLHSPDYDDLAVREFDGVLKRDPAEAAALCGLGYAYLKDRDFARAAELLGKAERVNPQDARVHYYSALLIKEEAGPATPPAPEKIAAMQQHLKKVIALEPHFAAAFALLAYTFESQGNVQKGLEAIKHAAELNPQNRSYRSQLARMNGGVESAMNLRQLEPNRSALSTQASGK